MSEWRESTCFRTRLLWSQAEPAGSASVLQMNSAGTGHVGNPMGIANMVLYLCSDKAGFITGENICIDGGMTRQMIYHGDFGWSLEG